MIQVRWMHRRLIPHTGHQLIRTDGMEEMGSESASYRRFLSCFLVDLFIILIFSMRGREQWSHYRTETDSGERITSHHKFDRIMPG